MNIGYIYSLIFVTISSLKPIFFKKFKKYQFANIFAANISFFFTSLIIVSIKLDDDENIEDKLEKSLEKKAISLSIISTFSQFAKIIAISFLPISIIIPLLSSWIWFGFLFDYLINDIKLTQNQIICGLILFIGLILVSYDKLQNTNKLYKNNYFKYKIGLIFGIISTILSGYIHVKCYNMTRSDNPEQTMLNQSVMAFIISSIFYIILYSLKIETFFTLKIEYPNFNTFFKIFVTLFFFYSSLFFKFLGMKYLNNYQPIMISNLKIVITLCFGYIILNESFSYIKILGIILILLAIVLGDKFINMINNLKIITTTLKVK